MRIGVKPGQIGMSIGELIAAWRAAEDLGFESVWTFDHLSGVRPCFEPLSLLAAMATVTSRVRIGCLVLVNGLRHPLTLAAQLATIDALSNGRLEVGLGAGDSFAKADFDAAHLNFSDKASRVTDLRNTLLALQTSLDHNTSDIAAKSMQQRVPLIVGGRSEAIRQIALELQVSWNCSCEIDESAFFAELMTTAFDPQAQVFIRSVNEVKPTVEAFQQAGATRLVLVLDQPKPDFMREVARAAFQE